MTHPESTAAPHLIDAGPRLPQPHQQVVAWGYPHGPMAGPAGLPVPVQIAPPASTEPPEWAKQLAPVIMQQATRIANTYAESRESKSVLDYQEADAALRDSRSQALVSTSAAIANLAHAIADLKEVKERTEVTGAIAQAALRLANSIQPMPDDAAARDMPAVVGHRGLVAMMSEGRLPPGTVVVESVTGQVVPILAFEDAERSEELGAILEKLGHKVAIVEETPGAG